VDQSQAVRLQPGLVAVLALVSTMAIAASVSALDVPALSGRVGDLAHVLPASTVESLSAQLAAHETQTGNQVAVLILPSLEGEPLEEFSHRVATVWKLGQKGTDNGVLLLVAIRERKVRIEVGYGLEGALTDARSAQIIRNDIVPRFRAGDLSGGVTAGVDAIVRTIEGTYQVSGEAVPPQQNEYIQQIVLAVIVGVVVGLGLMGIHRFLGPVAGTGISMLLAPWMAPALITGGITLLLLLVLFVAGTGTRGGRYRGVEDEVWYSSRFGGWGGGSFGGVGGGFSGGGGDFGGGGASGNW
jgi:uncharacterized protein